MIKSKVGSIKSGWRSVFMIFTAASDDDLEPIVESAFENVEQGWNHFFIFYFSCEDILTNLEMCSKVSDTRLMMQLYWNTSIRSWAIVLWIVSTA